MGLHELPKMLLYELNFIHVFKVSDKSFFFFSGRSKNRAPFCDHMTQIYMWLQTNDQFIQQAKANGSE